MLTVVTASTTYAGKEKWVASLGQRATDTRRPFCVPLSTIAPRAFAPFHMRELACAGQISHCCGGGGWSVWLALGSPRPSRQALCFEYLYCISCMRIMDK